MSLGDTLNHRQWNLSLSDTNALKGIALILLLCHHLFYIQDGSYNDILVFGKYPLVQEFGLACKVCVAIFVFLSGYGLAPYTVEYPRILCNPFYEIDDGVLVCLVAVYPRWNIVFR